VTRRVGEAGTFSLLASLDTPTDGTEASGDSTQHMRTTFHAAGAVALALLLVLAGPTVLAQPAIAAVAAHATTDSQPIQTGPLAGSDYPATALVTGPTAFSPGGAAAGHQYDALSTATWDRSSAGSYSRLDGSDPLENDARAAVYDAVTTAPGVYLARLAELSDVPRSTVRYHVRVLERENLVQSAKQGGKRRYFPTGVEDVAATAALHDDATRAVVEALDAVGPTSVSALARELDLSAATVSYHLDRLESDGVVVRERAGNEVRNALSESARSAMRAAATGGD